MEAPFPTVLWSRSYHELATTDSALALPEVEGFERKAQTTSVISASIDSLWTAIELVYVSPDFETPIPNRRILARLDTLDGHLEGYLELSDKASIEGAVSLGADGRLYVPHLAYTSSKAYCEYNNRLPEAFQVPAPVAGVSIVKVVDEPLWDFGRHPVRPTGLVEV